jgi:hypothetical protein
VDSTPIGQIAPAAGGSARRILSPSGSWCLAGLIALAHVLLAVTATLDESPTFDEPTHLTAGYSYWIKNDYRLDPENGNLPARWAALPLLLNHVRFPGIETPSQAWNHSSVGLTSRQFFFESGNDADAILLQGRLMMSLFGAALCLVVFGWARSLFGIVGGLISEALMALDPNMLAHGALATSDVAAAFFFTVAVWTLWRVLHLLSLPRLVAAGLSFSGLFLTKMSAPSILLMAATLSLIRFLSIEPIKLRVGSIQKSLSNGKHKAAAICCVAIVLAGSVYFSIWAAYGFRYSALSEDGLARDIQNANWETCLHGAGLPAAPLRFIRDHHLLPEAYVYGVTYVALTSKSRPSFLDERWSIVGFPDFFPRAFLYKTPLPVFGFLVVAGLAGVLTYVKRSRSALRSAAPFFTATLRIVPLLVIISIYGLFALCTKLSIGHRHLLPIYPAIFVLCGASAWFCMRRRLTIGAAVVTLLFGWEAIASFSARPHYLAYFNETIGRPDQAYKHLVDSSLDWGQDLPSLKCAIDSLPNGEATASTIHLAYFGTADPKYYGIDATILPGEHDSPELRPLTPGLYCVSATILQQVYEHARGPWALPYEQSWQLARAWAESQRADPSGAGAASTPAANDLRLARLRTFRTLRFGRLCAYLRHRQPIMNVGYSIFLFRLTQKDLDVALNGQPAELAATVEVAAE